MSTNQTPPVVPVPLIGDVDQDQDVTKEVDGTDVLDPDVSDDLIDSADADRLAAGGDAEPLDV